MERTVKYSRELYDRIDREEALSTFLYELPNLTACNIFPPLHILNTLLLRGWTGGNMGIPRFVWEPFEISDREYREILPKILNPNWALLCQKIWYIRLPMKLDNEFDEIDDRYLWMENISQKYRSSSYEEENEKWKKEIEAHIQMLIDLDIPFQLKDSWNLNQLRERQ
jgi:hypothetical protein